MTDFDVHEAIISLLDKNNVNYRLMEHEPEGQSDLISKIRGNELSQGAKAMVILVKIGKKTSKYYLAVIPADKKINLNALKALSPHATRAMFAPEQKAEQLTNCVMGSVPPFSFNKDLEVIVDPLLLENIEIVFNAGRLDKSIFMSSESYVSAAKPTILSIAI
ncbi:MAG: YbaK/prolyl-tRNA synthetase associated domain-containing protein [Thiohalocapsa sp. PB-PSB1]|jgi:Ala-tRNA(Pro) deacylase|nr:MAG: YbaK/prolyl-tRNA synthetase associated domain-containing protein [Thiohalocapsa sp. PB-PSB1]